MDGNDYFYQHQHTEAVDIFIISPFGVIVKHRKEIFIMAEIEQTLDSREVALMVEKDHNKLLRDIRRYIKQLGEAKIGHSNFFRESTYLSGQNKEIQCYEITLKGCEFIAHKLTGTKGTEFTARYINRFHDMQTALEQREERKEIEDIRKEIKEQRKMLNKLMSGMNPPARIGTYRADYSENEAYRSEIVKAIERRNDTEYLMGVYSFAITYLNRSKV